MEPLEIDRKLSKRVMEAGKAMKLSDSHQELRGKIQDQLSRNHRVNNPYSEYLDHPYVVHTFGDNAKGSVVYRRGDQHMAAPYKSKEGDGGKYEIGDGKPVQVAYIHQGNANEALRAELPGITFTESLAAKDESVQEITFLQESAFNKDGIGEVKVIGPGAGSSGFWTRESLKQAVKDKVWDKGTQMFMDHPTEDERKRSGTGSISKLVATFQGPAYYKESHKEGEGVYAPVKAYDSHVKFLNERSKDIGTSVNVGVIHSNVMKDGVPVVERIVQSARNTVDFVSRAGAGGKLVQMFESFRAKESSGERQPAAGSSGMEINEQEYKRLSEAAAQVPTLLVRLDRLDETNQRFEARSIAMESLTVSGLKPRGQQRVLDMVCGEHSALPVDATSKKLDVAKFRENLKKAIDDETAYVQESGGSIKPVVSGVGDVVAAPTAEEVKAQEGLLTKAQESLAASVNSLAGVKEVKS